MPPSLLSGKAETGAKFSVWLTGTSFNVETSDSPDTLDEAGGSESSDPSDGSMVSSIASISIDGASADSDSQWVSFTVVASDVSGSSVAVVSSGG